MSPRVRDAIYGAIAGVNGAACMSVVRLVARRAGVIDVMPPQILREAVTGSEHAPSGAHVGDHALHLAIGAAGAAAYAALAPRAKQGPLTGMLFGTGLWALSFLSFVPSLGTRRAAKQAMGPQSAVNLLAHLVYGALLPVMVRDMEEQARRRPWRPDRAMRRVG